jgi:hypothetical protein
MKIAMYDLEGHLLEVFEVETIVELEDKLKISRGGIYACLSGKALTTKHFQFREVINTNKIITRVGDVSHTSQGQFYKPIHKFYKGVFICTYDNASRAAELNKLTVANISSCLTERQKTAGGFEWKYAV